MKKILLILLSVMLLPWAVQADELKLYETASSSSNLVPFDGYNADAAQHNQLIYPASELAAMSGKNITQMVFYIDPSGANGTYTGAERLGTWTVSLGESSSTTLSGLDNSTPLTQVYQGYFDCSSGTLTLEFSEEYPYSGGNLLIDLNHSAASWNKWYFLGVSASGASYTYGSQRDFLPRVTFSYSTPSSCAKPGSLAASNVLDSEATLSWTEKGEASSWQLCINDDESNLIDVTEIPYTLTELDPLTAYSVKVRANCGSEFSDWTNAIQFTTTAVATVIGDSWSDDFENGLSWELINGTLTNKWVLGSAVSNGGTQSLYISNDNGTSHAYALSSDAMVYATKLLQFEDGKYEFSFDWLANGESTFDFLRVALVPASETLVAGTSKPSGFDYNTLPGTWTALDGGSKLNLSTSWQNQLVAKVLTAGNYYLVFAWRNDDGGGTNPPAAIDNVQITKFACPYDAAGLAVDPSSIETESMLIQWNENVDVADWEIAWSKDQTFPEEETKTEIVYGTDFKLTELEEATIYYIKLRAYCGGSDYGSWSAPISVATACKVVGEYPWSENFDGYTVASSYSPSERLLPICWSSINKTTYSSYINYPSMSSYVGYSSSTNYHSTPNYMRLYSYYSSYTDYDPQPQYAILPEMDLYKKRIVLWARGENASSTLKVGEIKDPSDENTFNLIEELVLTTSYQKFTINLAGDASYIALMIDAASSSRSTNGVYIDDITVEEIPSCLEPSGLEFVSSTSSSAVFNWQNGDSESQWDIYYSTENVAPTAETEPSIAATSDKEIPSGLNAATNYFIWIRSHCNDSEFSPWIGGIKFQTECEAISAADIWREDFNAYSGSTSASVPSGYPGDELPLCWSFLNRSTSSSSYPQVFISSNSGYNVSGNCLFFKSTNSGAIYAILPQFSEEISTLQLTFTYRNEGVSGSNGTLHAGYMADPSDASTFVSVLDCEQTTTLTEKEALFQNAPSGSYIAFQYMGGSAQNYYLSIDDVMVGPIPTCLKPSSPVCDAKTAHTATLSWTNGEEGQNAWQIALDTIANFNPDTLEAARIIDVFNNPAVISGLEANKYYYAYVRANCGDSDKSLWSKAKVSFKTLAGNIVPSGLAMDATTLSSFGATINWSGAKTNDLHEGYEIYYSQLNALPETLAADSLVENISDTAYAFVGLTPETTYYVWVRDICGADGNSAWTGPLGFTTLANCPVPATLSASEVEAYSAKISWEIGTNDKYNVRYRNPASERIFLADDFENGLGDWTKRSCHSTTGINSNKGVDGSKCFYFYYSTNPPQYLISPVITDIDSEARLEFDYKNESTSFAETFQVGYSLTDDATESFTFGDEISVSDAQWHKYSEVIPAGTKYICIKYTSNDQFYLYIDNISITGKGDDAGDWTIVNGTDDAKSLVLSGLQPDTKYEAQVQGVCGTTETEWSEESVLFTTIPSCTAPIVADPVIRPDGAEFSWTATNGETQFQYACVEKNAAIEEWILLDENVLSVIINGKASGVNYDFYVRAYCSETDQSEAVKSTFSAYCPAPSSANVSEITSNSATISWNAAEGITKYQYVVMPAGSDADWTQAEFVEDVTVGLDGLNASSSYKVYIRSYYNEFSQSSAISVTFTTECLAISVVGGWIEDFNTYSGASSTSAPSAYPNDELPTCWSFLNRSDNSSFYPQVFISSNSGYNVSGNSLFFKSAANSAIYAILPQFVEEISTLQLTFTYRNESTYDSNGTLYAGYMTDPSDASTFVSVLECEKTASLTEKEAVFTEAPAGSYIAFQYMGGSNQNYYLSIDDVKVSILSSCKRPASIEATNITDNSAVLTWVAGGEETKFDYIIVAKDLTPDWNNAETVEAFSVELTELAANTAYDFYVRANCGDDQSDARSISFHTACGAIVVDADNAFEEGFEAESETYGCWEMPAVGTYTWKTNTTTSYVHSGAQSAYSGYYGDVYLIMPLLSIADDAKKNVKMSFYSYNTFTSSYDKNSVVLLGDTEAELWSPESVSQEWIADTIDLSAFKGQTIRLAFKYVGDNAHGWYVDDVKIEFVAEGGTGTGIDAIESKQTAIKRIENDQVVIIRDGKKYTIMGVKIQ